MYGSIYVPLDNSDHSNAAGDVALRLAKAFEAKLVGSHVYAAKLHDVRFKQMEFTLPDEYKEENELEKQRRIHDALIARGLQLISDSYLEVMAKRAAENSVPFEAKHFDGKNFEVLVDDIRGADYDLIVMGALGQGAVRDSTVGSVCERVLRRTAVDTLVVRDPESAEGEGALLVALDGSPHSHGALQSAIAFAKATGRALEIVAVTDESQGDEAELLTAHVEMARALAEEAGVRCTATRLSGQPLTQLMARAEQVEPFAIVVGRQGLDARTDGDTLGSLTERLLRRAPCNVLIAARPHHPAASVVAAE